MAVGSYSCNIVMRCLQVACILLPLCFVYDVFWVFLQPLLTNGDSVMVKVSILYRSPTVFGKTLPADGATDDTAITVSSVIVLFVIAVSLL